MIKVAAALFDFAFKDDFRAIPRPEEINAKAVVIVQNQLSRFES